MSIYSLMKKDWEIYCLMAGIMYIEEMTKPYSYKLIKSYKGKKANYVCYRTLRLKGKEYSIIKKWFDITKIWEKKFDLHLIGDPFNEIKKEDYSGQYYFNFSPNWLYNIIKIVGILPSKHTQNYSIERLKNWKKSKTQLILSQKELDSFTKKSLYKKLFNDKFLAAGAMIISFDLEFRGTTTGQLSLCMSEKYKDFLEFMLAVADKWKWATKNSLFSVSVQNSRKLGIKASPQFEFRISTKKLKEIYDLAGPLCSLVKDKAISFHAERSNSYVNLGGLFKLSNKRELIYKLIKENGPTKTTILQYDLNIGTDVILGYLHRLEAEGRIVKERNGKRYIWSIKNAH